MSISSEISRLTALRNRIKNKLNSLGLLVSNTPSSGNEGGGSDSKAGTSSNTVTGDDLDACTEAIESINETTPYLLSSTGAKNVAGYKYAQVDTTVFEPIGSSGSINPNAQNAYIGASGGISTSAPSGSVPVSLGQISPSGNYQGMSAVNLLYDSNVIKEENIKSGVSILGVTGKYGLNCIQIDNNEYDSSGGTTNSISFTLPQTLIDLTLNNITSIVIMLRTNVSMGSTYEITGVFYDRDVAFSLGGQYKVLYNYVYDDTLFSSTKIRFSVDSFNGSFSLAILPNNGGKRLTVSLPSVSDDVHFTKQGIYMLFMRY